jgi:glycine betaine/choline ABC-type transport system substrate-binding protein
MIEGVIAGLTSAALLCVAGGPPLPRRSKNFTEQVLLGEIVSQHLEARLAWRWNVLISAARCCAQAITSGAIDLYPEYTGHRAHRRFAVPAVVRTRPPARPRRVPAAVFLVWLLPLGFDDSFAW